MAQNILVVDRNTAFATFLREMLETDGGYHVDVAHSGKEAMARLRQADFDLTIVDMDLDPEDMRYSTLIKDIRRIRPGMRLVLIPLMGKDLPPETNRLGIQGTLSKPFFADDLLPSIEASLAKHVEAPKSQPAPALQPATPPAPQPIAYPASRRPESRRAGSPAVELQAVLSELARQTNANVVLLLSTATGEPDIVAKVTTLDKDSIKTLANMSATAVQAAQAIARFWDHPDTPFEHNMFESQSLRLYIMALSENLLLMIITPVSTQLGTIRYTMRRAANRVTGLALT